MKSSTLRRSVVGQRGFTLAEVLVASAIFTVIIVAALLLYDRSNQVFKASTESADLQQNSRIAFDKLVADVRMAGFDYDRDGIPTGVTPSTWQNATSYVQGSYAVPSVANGHQYIATTGGISGGTEPSWPTASAATVTDNTVTWQENSGVNQYQQPDEQIEYVGKSAITVRANFNYNVDPVNTLNGRVASLEAATPQFPVITTSNDEIVTYALVSVNGTNPDTVSFYADVNAAGTPQSRRAYPGGTAERNVQITGVDLSNNNPPYTLYRFTINDDGTINRTPMANNIRSLRFKYYEDSAGATTLKDLSTTPVDVSDGTSVLGLGQYDPAHPDAVVSQRLIRAKVRSIQVELVGMNPNLDNNYTDTAPGWNATTDTVSPHTRKMMLSTLVVPRNLGKRGQREQVTIPPGSPTITNVCVGYCGLVKLTWQAPASGGVSSYAIAYDTSASGAFVNLVQVGPTTTGYVSGLVPNTPYWFRVQAINDFGASASSTTTSSFTPQSATTPGDPTSIAASGGGGGSPAAMTNEIDVTWQAPATYSAGSISCSPTATSDMSVDPKDVLGYNVWRGTSPTVNTAGTPYVAYNATTNAPSVNYVTGVVTFKDTNIVNCINYYYKIQAVKPSCEGNAAYYTSPSVPHSNIVPAGASNSTLGQAASTGSAPQAPSDLQIKQSSFCTGGVCTVKLAWPPTTQDTAATPNTITIDKYEIIRTQKLSGVVTTTASSPSSTVGSNAPYVGVVSPLISSTGWATNGAALCTYNDNVPQTDNATSRDYSYDYQVRAVQCTLPSAYSVLRSFPCFFSGTVGATVTPVFQGSGTLADPFLIDTPGTITTTSTTGVASMHPTVYVRVGAAWNVFLDMTPITGSPTITSGTWTMPQGTLGSTYEIDTTFTDTNGCTTHKAIYATDEESGCCLVPKADDATVEAFTSGTTDFVELNLKNTCTDPLNIQASGFTLTWTDGGVHPSPHIDHIEYPTAAASGTGVALCSFTTATTRCFTYTFPNNSGAGSYTVPTGASPAASTAAQVAASAANYKVRIFFDRNISVQPLTNFAVIYERPAVDSTPQTCPNIP